MTGGTGEAGNLSYDDPRHLADGVSQAARPLLLGLDIDGVLAPLVDHADDARLLDGVAEVLGRLATADDILIAAISGRALASMRTFGLPATVRLIGSHGMEADDHAFRALDDDERSRLDRLIALADDAAATAGDGGWVEHKQASVAVHTRLADPDLGRQALQQLAARAQDVEGAAVKPGSDVLELFARHASKGTALAELTRRTAAACTVFIGDDLTDEEAFAVLDDSDVTIKVGTASTIAAHRLADPPAVLAFLTALAEASGV